MAVDDAGAATQGRPAADGPGGAPSPAPGTTPAEERLAAAAARAGRSWRRLGLRARAITPSGLAHFLLAVLAVAAIAWLAVASWPALLPFILGGVIAYTVLPVVNWLDGAMPRPLAALLTMAGVVALIALFLAGVIPPLAREAVRLYDALPSQEEVRGYPDRLNTLISGLPAPVRDYLRREAEQAASNVRAGLNQYLQYPLRSLAGLFLGLLSSIGFVLGFLVVPTWLLAVLNDQRTAVRAINRVLPASLAPDFWAVVRILDRIFGAFVRGRLVQGLAVGCATWVGLTLVGAASGHTGSEGRAYVVLLALLAGVLELVPTIGPIVGAVIGVLLGLTFSWQVAVLVLLTYIIARQVVNTLITPHLERRVIDLNPAVLVMAIVALSQFGFIWVLLAAPVIAVARDLFRYVYGRVADPPLPAGSLPGRLPASPAAAPAPQRVPLTYRRGRAARQP